MTTIGDIYGLPGYLSEYIKVNGLDLYGSNGHEALDDILDVLNQPDIEHLKSPKDRKDYVSFTRLVLNNVIFLKSVGVGEPGVEAVRAKLTSDTGLETWADFKRLVDE